MRSFHAHFDDLWPYSILDLRDQSGVIHIYTTRQDILKTITHSKGPHFENC